MNTKCITTFFNYNFLPQMHHALWDSDKYAFVFCILSKIYFPRATSLGYLYFHIMYMPKYFNCRYFSDNKYSYTCFQILGHDFTNHFPQLSTTVRCIFFPWTSFNPTKEILSKRKTFPTLFSLHALEVYFNIHKIPDYPYFP